jgi:enoyl-CoA hydratase
MDYQHIIYQPGKVARVILNRPRYLNAQGWLMREEMDDAFNRAVADKEVGAVVLSGAGQHFSAGHDIGTAEDREYRTETGHANTDRYGAYRDLRIINLENHAQWRNLAKPTIAMVHGYCIFGGWMFAAVMDIVFAAEDALFLPGNVEYFSTPYEIGFRKAKEIIFEHRFITAREAHEYGFVNRIFPPDKLEEETLAYAERVADNYLSTPFVVQMAKFSINHMMDAMGFSAEMEGAFQNFCLMEGLQPKQHRKPEEGGYARTDVAFRNFESTKPWLKKKGLE